MHNFGVRGSGESELRGLTFEEQYPEAVVGLAEYSRTFGLWTLDSF